MAFFRVNFANKGHRPILELGSVASTMLIAEMLEIGGMTGEEAAALTGMAPVGHDGRARFFSLVASSPRLPKNLLGGIAVSRVFPVSCVAGKRPRATPAAELYTSAWFVKVRALVEASGDPWFILSAEHGLLAPEKVIEPYGNPPRG